MEVGGGRIQLNRRWQSNSESHSQHPFSFGCKAICDWLIVERNSGVASVQIVEAARLILDICEQNNTLPRDVAPHGTPLLEIIKRTRPAQPNTDETSYVSWYTGWLALWAAYSMTDSWVRYKAIDLALREAAQTINRNPAEVETPYRPLADSEYGRVALRHLFQSFQIGSSRDHGDCPSFGFRNRARSPAGLRSPADRFLFTWEPHCGNRALNSLINNVLLESL